MKRLSFFILFFLILQNVLHSQYIYFNKRIDISGSAEVCRSIIYTYEGYLVAGGLGETSTFIYISKIDSLGNLKWTQNFGSPGYNYFLGLSGSLFKTFDKNFSICGSRVPYNSYSLLIKIDTTGNKIWEKEYQILFNNSLNYGNIAKDSGFILTGKIRTSSSNYCYSLIKTDSLGNLQWYKSFSDNHPNTNYEGNSVIQTTDNGYCLGGYGGYYDVGKYKSITEIIKTDEFGSQQWKKTYGNPLNCNTGVMLCLSDDNNIVGAYSLCNSGDLHVDRQIYLTKISYDGTVIWNKEIGNKEIAMWVSWIQTLNDGSFVVSGSHGIRDTIIKNIGWLFKLNNNGDSIWYREYAIITGAQDVNQLWQFTPTPDKGFAGAGSLFPGEGGGTQDIWLFKTDSLGCLVPNCTGIGITEFNPNAGAQMFIYPNPFKNAFAINYLIPAENKKAVFELRDVMGNLVYSTHLTTNANQLQVAASALLPGIYFASFLVDDVLIKTEKIIKN